MSTSTDRCSHEAFVGHWVQCELPTGHDMPHRGGRGVHGWTHNPPSPCRTACPSKDHATFGECVRAARIEIDRTALASGRDD